MNPEITDKQRLDYLEQLVDRAARSELHIQPVNHAAFSLYLRSAPDAVPFRSHHGVSFRDMIDDAILSSANDKNAGDPPTGDLTEAKK